MVSDGPSGQDSSCEFCRFNGFVAGAVAVDNIRLVLSGVEEENVPKDGPEVAGVVALKLKW